MTATWETNPRSLLDALPIRATLPYGNIRRAALYVRVSTSDRGQTVENQLQPLQEAAGRLGWTVVAIYRDEGISGTKGRDKRPGLDALLKGVARREFDIVAAWWVCRLGRSLSDLIGLLGELRSATSTSICTSRRSIPARHPAECCSGCWGCLRVRAGDDPRPGAGGTGSRAIIGQAPGQAEDDAVPGAALRLALDEGRGVRETARLLKISAAKVSEVRRMSAVATKACIPAFGSR